MADLYNILGVDKTASQDDIKKAYRKLASKHHPDRGGNTQKFQEIQTAYDTLSDPNKRAEYDNPRPQFNGNWQGEGVPPGFEDLFSSFGFGDIFGQRRSSRAARNRDLNLETQITLAEAYSGKELIASVQLPSGRDQTLEVKIPAGVRDGTTLRLNGMGDDSVSNIPRGNINLTIRVKPDHRFRREGDDLVMEHTISCFDAILGKTVQFQTIDGKTLETNIPPGIQPGQTMSVHGHGMPNMNDPRMKGRLLIKVNITIPKTLTDSQKDSLRKIIQ